MIAIIKTGGKQYRALEGEKLRLEKIEGGVGDVITFSEVLLVGDEQSVQVGTPLVSKASVIAKIVEQGRADKVWGIKHKPKKRYRMKFGHRQPYTEVEVTKIAVAK
ncbi:MAG: 50S ribosomal protein L21 [Candidatus Moraniibacteriota bacterium]|nr:MAG: 50S ribosomal protein L21 [Candidatus Moranbacteria bacterium]